VLCIAIPNAREDESFAVDMNLNITGTIYIDIMHFTVQ
jgi:hypothetical protein